MSFRQKGDPIKTLQYDQLVSILKLATMWEMADIRQRVISRLIDLSARDPIAQIRLGYTYNAEALVTEGLVSLIVRDIPLSDEEGTSFNLLAALRIFRLRELYLKRRIRGYCDLRSERAVVQLQIQTTFGETLSEHGLLAN